MPEPDDSKVPVKPEPPHSHDHYDHAHHHGLHHPLLLAAGAAIVLVLLVATAAMHHAMQSGFGSKPYVMGRGGQIAGPPNTQAYGSRTQGSNQSRLEGVVTNVSGNTLTIAGDGATNTVQTSGSTQYTNATAAKVNDTVIVTGTIANSTFTATQIVINP